MKTGKERFLNGLDATVLDFWCWAYSDMLQNTERGRLAEYLVVSALQNQTHTRKEWENVDCISRNGVRVEVKSAAYIQAWEQNSLSQLRFSITPTRAWNEKNKKYETVLKRQADVYVFCVFAAKERENANVLDLKQWEFYILETEVLNQYDLFQKSISLKKLLALGARKTEYCELKYRIEEIKTNE